MFIIYLSLSGWKFQERFSLMYQCIPSTMPGKGIQNILVEWINGINQSWNSREDITWFLYQEIYPKMSTSFGQKAQSSFLLSSSFRILKALTDSYSSDNNKMKALLKTKKSVLILTSACFKQMQRGHFFSAVHIASHPWVSLRCSKPTPLPASAPGAY